MKLIMVKIINLNKKRKVKTALAKEKKAAANRIIFGRTKKEKQIATLENHRDDRRLDDHKLEQKESKKE